MATDPEDGAGTYIALVFLIVEFMPPGYYGLCR